MVSQTTHPEDDRKWRSFRYFGVFFNINSGMEIDQKEQEVDHQSRWSVLISKTADDCSSSQVLQTYKRQGLVVSEVGYERNKDEA